MYTGGKGRYVAVQRFNWVGYDAVRLQPLSHGVDGSLEPPVACRGAQLRHLELQRAHLTEHQRLVGALHSAPTKIHLCDVCSCAISWPEIMAGAGAKAIRACVWAVGAGPLHVHVNSGANSGLDIETRRTYLGRWQA